MTVKKKANAGAHGGVRLSTLTIALVAVAILSAAGICITLFTSVYGDALFRDARVSSEQSVRQTTLAVNNYLESMKSDVESVGEMASECDTVEKFTDYARLYTNLRSDIYAISVYGSGGELLMCVSGELSMKEALNDISFAESVIPVADGEFSVSKPHVQFMFEGVYPWVVTVTEKYCGGLFGENVYIAVDFRFSEIAKYIDHVGVGRHGYCYIADPEGNIIYHPKQQLLYSGLKTENTSAALMSDGVHVKGDVIYTIASTDDGRWKTVGVNFTDELAVERRTQVINGLFVSLACCAAISVIVLVLFSVTVSTPVNELIAAMRDFEKRADSIGNINNAGVAELQALNESFSHMAHRIMTLMEDVRREETALRKTELRALQAQINPHFLYNTLDSIQWMCEQGNTEDAVKMVGALAKLFRISISRGKELIPISDEVKHAESYLLIQSFRYKNQFSYSFDVEPGLENCLCNKITIQPLLENAIYHGIDRMVDEGEIKVTVRTAEDDENDIIIKVADNGVGMTEEQCRKILRKEKSDSQGIGVKNVNDRLAIYFGEKYGLSIESELDVGTTVTVRIPKIDKEAEHEIH